MILFIHFLVVGLNEIFARRIIPGFGTQRMTQSVSWIWIYLLPDQNLRQPLFFGKLFRTRPSDLSPFQLPISGTAPQTSHYFHALNIGLLIPLSCVCIQCSVLRGISDGRVQARSVTGGEKNTFVLLLPKAPGSCVSETCAVLNSQLLAHIRRCPFVGGENGTQC